MRKKILCPFHKEDTPSCNLYSNGYYCFGCGARGKLSDLRGVPLPPPEELEPEPPEDLEATFVRLSQTTKPTPVRGLTLPADERGYYIVWPDYSYYKLRFWDPGKGPKYIGARGHKRPLFWARRHVNEQAATLVLVEGEINALSLAEALKDEQYDIASPGGVGDFTENRMRSGLNTYKNYGTIIVVVDADAAGAKAAISALSVLWASNINALAVSMSPDANDKLVAGEQESIRSEITGAVRRAMEKGTG